MPNPLINRLSRSCESNPQQPFAVLEDGRSLSYGTFFRNASLVAAALRSLGVQPGDRIAVQADKSIAVLEAYLGTVMAGAVFLPINPAYTFEEVSYIVSDAAPRILVCQPERRSSFRQLRQFSGLEALETLDRKGNGTLQARASRCRCLPDFEERKPDDTAALLYTSGTTGRPKGVVLSHNALASNSQVLAKLWRFTRDDILIHALPVFHTHGLFVATNVALVSGCTLRFFESFDADKILSGMADSTTMMGVPTFYTRLLSCPELSAAIMPGMRLFVSGSAPLLAKTHRQWRDRTGHEILERYGMTEANMITSVPYGGPRKPGTVGIPLPGVTVRIADPESGKEVENGATGILEVKSPGLFEGYWGLPEKTRAEHTDDGYFKTGDFARLDEDGYVVIMGRSGDLVISGGFNVYPKEVELVINDVPGVRECAVFGVPHPDFGEGLVAAIVGSGDNGIVNAIRSLLSGKLARYKHPKEILVLNSLPRNSMGKIQRFVLREHFTRLFD